MPKNTNELTNAEVNAYDDELIIVCIGEVRKECLTDCLDDSYWITPKN